MARPIGIRVLGGLAVLLSTVLIIAGLLGVLAGQLGLVVGSGETAEALTAGGAVFVVLGAVLGISDIGMMRWRPWGWWLAVVTTLVAILWSLVRIFQVLTVVHPEWYAILGLGAVFFGYLLAVHQFFHREDLG